MLKTILSILSLVICVTIKAQEVPQTLTSASMDSLKTTVSKLIDFYDSYEDGSPESLKKAKFDDAVDALPGSVVSEKDKADGYHIVDAYIKGDKALEQDKSQQNKKNESFDDAIKNTDKAKAAQEYLDQQKDLFMQMSYAEFEDYLLKINPIIEKKEIKTAYNEMHKNDGKQVSINSEDEEMTETQLQMWAIDTLNNPKNCADFRKALQILKVEIPESDIQKACEKINKN